MTTIQKIFSLIKSTNKSENALEKEIGLSQGQIKHWRNGRNNVSADALHKIADYFNVSVDYLLGRTEHFAQEFSENEMYTFPVIGTICAGYDGIAEESYTGEDMIVPPHLIKTRNPDDYFVLEVKGDSMSPLLENGDKVLIRRCNSVDSGTVAAVGFNDEQATVKKVEYIKGEDWMRLVPRNPDYPVITIKGSDLELCRVYGEVVYLFRDKIGF